jgi:hypothetical protein
MLVSRVVFPACPLGVWKNVAEVAAVAMLAES